MNQQELKKEYVMYLYEHNLMHLDCEMLFELVEHFYRLHENEPGVSISANYDMADDIPRLKEIEERKKLAESEDERIRKFLVDYFVSYKIDNVTTKLNGVRIDDILNYLEKQKEQEPAKKPSMLELLREHLANTPKEQLDAEFEALKEFTIPKPAEWSEDWREEDIQTRFAFYTYKDDSSVLYLSNVFVEEASRNHGFGTRILRAAEKVAETIGAITICLKVKQDSPANAWYRKNGYGYVAFEDGYDWLEKNLEYLKPAKSTEWSEEDEKYLSQAIETLEHENYSILADKLKTLRSPKSSDNWKPSEEQMNAFKGYIEDFQARAEAAVGGWNNFDVMIRLYEQLKKLYKKDEKI